MATRMKRTDKVRKAVFLDRDGVILGCDKFTNAVEDVVLLPGVSEGLRILASAGFELVVATNQGGVGLGYMTEEDLTKIHSAVNGLVFDDVLFELCSSTIPSLRFYACTHKPSEGCWCRKPNTGLATRASDELGIDLTKSYMVGDEPSDMEFGVRAGIPVRISVMSGRWRESPFATATVQGLLQAAQLIVERETK